MSDPIVVAENLSKSFTDHGQRIRLWQSLHFKIHPGDKISLMGASGTGKSSLIHVLAGLLPFDEGELYINQQPLKSMSNQKVSQLRTHAIGLVFQQFHLISCLTVEQNILMVRRMKGLPIRADETKNLADQLGLVKKLKMMPNQLSGGEQQRVAIGRALAAEPAIILADEPTGSLDEKTAAQVMTLFLECVQAYQTTLFMVTHQKQYAKQLDQLWRLENGVIQCC